MKVVIGGPPHSGKSTFTASLIQVIRERQWRQGYNLQFTWVPLDITDNSIAVLLNPDDDIQRKRDVEWTQERAEERQATFEARDEQLVIADAPGMITEELKIVIAPADAIIILASYEKQDRIDEWKEVASDQNLDVFAEITTILEEDLEIGWRDRDARKGTLQSVEREEFIDRQIETFDDTTRRLLRQLGTDLLKEASRNQY